MALYILNYDLRKKRMPLYFETPSLFLNFHKKYIKNGMN